MIKAWGLLAVGLALGGPVAAGSFENCSRPDEKVVSAAITGAADLTLRAAASVGDSPQYALWFGRFEVLNGEAVRANLKAIHRELLADEVKAQCLGAESVDCKDGTYAYVLLDRPSVIHLCPAFFLMPTMADAYSGWPDMEDGTREGTIIHELSHFPFVASTGDECYGRGTCANLASHDPARAITTADSYQYFAEDIAVAARLIAK